MTYLHEILIFLACYLIGSIPTSVWISKYIYGADIRTFGSGNAGSTNMFRTFGFKAGIATQIIDILKGVGAGVLVIFAHIYCDHPGTGHAGTPLFWNVEPAVLILLYGMAAVLGHIWPILAGFRGGKGINTLLGVMLVMDPLAAGIGLGVFIFTLLLTKMVSVSSMIGALSLPVYIIIALKYSDLNQRWGTIWLGVFAFLLIVFTHRTNIVRIVKGTESKIRFLKKS